MTEPILDIQQTLKLVRACDANWKRAMLKDANELEVIVERLATNVHIDLLAELIQFSTKMKAIASHPMDAAHD